VRDLAGRQYADQDDFVRQMRRTFSENQVAPLSKATLISAYRQLQSENKIDTNKAFANLLIKRGVRTMSGVSVITVLTKPFVCPGRCVYCPTESDMPKSYLSNEPAAMRAKLNLFDPYKQVTMRIKALENNGHDVDKLEILVLGGTWSVYPSKYQDEFVRDCFYAANTFTDEVKRDRLSLEEEQDINENTRYKIIGLTLETRPDFVSPTEIKKLRRLGCTRVQIGVQHTDNKILEYIKRGDTLEGAIKATRLLKEAGFKVDHHYMPDLPGSAPQKDLDMMKYVFTSPDLQPDQIKIYPCIVNEFAELNKWYQEGKYKPYAAADLIDLLLKIKEITPPYVRINRLIRDIPEESIIAGNSVTNLRQHLQATLKQQGKKCRCIRCREVRGETEEINQAVLVKREYDASGGKEIFLSYESPDHEKIYAFLRLRFNANSNENILPELVGASLVRELHVYGKMTPVVENQNEDDDNEVAKAQHIGFGKKLMAEAERLTAEQGLKKVAVISGIGVKNYYRKLGYELEGTYMNKVLS